MITQPFIVGALFTNCYVIYCQQTREAIIVDPGITRQTEAEQIANFMDKEELHPRLIINTHGHPDHTCGNGLIKDKFNTPILIHKNDAHMLGDTGKAISMFFGFEKHSPEADRLLKDADTITLGKNTLRVMHTPGHSPGSIVLTSEKEALAGDTLFQGSIGRTDLPGSSETDMNTSLKKLIRLPGYFIVYPGHGPATTIKEEKANNPFLQNLSS